jgi:hypothetical protein
MEAVQTSEMLMNSYQSRQRYNPGDSHLHSHCHKNLKSYLKNIHMLRPAKDDLGLKISGVYQILFECGKYTQGRLTGPLRIYVRGTYILKSLRCLH